MTCPNCKKEGAYLRVGTGEIVCRHGCGKITPAVKEVKKDKKK